MDPAPAVRRVARLRPAPYTPAEWELLTRLPGRIVVAATSAGPVDPRRTVAEGLAGMAGIAAGRAFDSDLVRSVAATIYARPDAPGPYPIGVTTGDAARAEVLNACRAVVRVLDGGTDPADSAIYRQWLQCLAVRVRRAAWIIESGTCRTIALVPAEERFPEALGEALGLG